MGLRKRSYFGEAVESLKKELTEAKSKKLIRDIKLKNGDVVPKGADANVKFLAEGDKNSHIMCNVYVKYTGKTGRDYMREPVKLRIAFLNKIVSGFSKPPSMSRLEKMVNDGIATTPTGRRVEPDGYGPDNSPSWLLVMGLI